MNQTNWTKDWPTIPGRRYWFYGWPYGRQKHVDGEAIEPEMKSVKVVQCRDNVICVCDGHFMHKSEGTIGMFSPADVPEAPDLSGSEWQKK